MAKTKLIHYSESELYTMDFDFFFKKDNNVIQVASNGEMLEKFLSLEKDKQKKLYKYFSGLENTSDFSISDESPAYPDNTSFTDWAKKGIFSYDVEFLVAIPTEPLKIDSLPADIYDLLTEY